MTRSILFSLVVIGAVVSLVAAAGTFAVFTDQQTGTAVVNTGTIDLELNDGIVNDSGQNEVLFENTENMLPGETVSWPVQLKNVGNRAWDVTDVTVTTSIASDPGGDCDYTPTTANLGVVVVPTFDGDDHDLLLHAEPGATALGTVQVVLPLDLPGETNDNDCQDVVWSGSAVVTATRARSVASITAPPGPPGEPVAGPRTGTGGVVSIVLKIMSVVGFWQRPSSCWERRPWAFGPGLTGWKGVVVLSGSMVATPTGEMPLVEPATIDDLRAGDIVTFRRPGGSSALVSHRIVAIGRQLGDTTLLDEG